MTTQKKVAKVAKVAKANGIESLLKWAKQAQYMLDTYEGTEHEDEVISDIENFLKRLGM